jgi:NADH-quinone oxidoreductase subunit J
MDTRPPIERTKDDAVSNRSAAVGNMARVVGNELMTRYMIAFEVAGLLLTAALVGAIAIAHREEIEPAAGSSKRIAQAGGNPAPNGEASAGPLAAHALGSPDAR